MVDRRNLSIRNREDVDPVKLDRFKYDQDDDEDFEPVYEKDGFGIHIMQHRAYLAAKSRDQAMQAQMQAQAAQNGRRLQNGATPTGQTSNNSTPNGTLKSSQSVS